MKPETKNAHSRAFIHQGRYMKKIMPMLFVLASLTVSCGKSGGSSSGASSTTPSEAVAAVSASGNIPAQALSFQTNVNLMNFDATQAAKYNQAVALVKKVVATEKFRSSILNYTWNGSKQFANNNGRTNAQIYQSILDAAETLQPAKNNRMDLGVKLYYAATTVIGWTNASITYINVNTKYFNNFAINDVAGNLFHEWLHKLGYGHDSAATAKRPYSVPYAVGYIVRDIGKSFL